MSKGRVLSGVGIGIVILLGVLALFVSNRGPSDASTKLRVRLEWVPQAQFAGYIAAKQLGFYRDVGLDVDLLPAGPDLKPQVTVAAGTDDVAVGVSNQVVTARSNGVPLKIIAQLFQDSANRYVLKKENAITSLRDLRGKPVGLWLGGDEAEFIAMLKTVNMTLKDVKVIAQEFSVLPFLQDKYVLSQVTVYNELNVIEREGFGPDKLQILSPANYGAAIVGDMLFTTEAFASRNTDTLTRFLSASLKGWQYALRKPEETVSLIVKYNPELTASDQRAQLASVARLIIGGDARQRGIGYMDSSAYAIAIKVLVGSGQISSPIERNSIFDARMWDAVPMEFKTVP